MNPSKMKTSAASVAAALLLASPALAQWAIRIGGPDRDHVLDLAVDDAGSVTVAGVYRGAGSLGETPFAAIGDSPLFISRLDAAGGVMWLQSFAGEVTGTVLGIGAGGDVFAAGSFDGAIDFGAGPQSGRATFEFFLLRLAADGTVVDSRVGGGGGQKTVDGGGIGPDGVFTIAGAFNSTIDLGSGPVTGPDTDMYIARFGPDGTPLSIVDYGGPPEDHSLAGALHSDGSIGVTGIFSLNDTNLGGTDLAIGAATGAAFVAHYDAAGAHLWSLASQGNDTAGGLAIAPTPDGGFVVGIDFDATMSLGPMNLTSGGGSDGAIVKLGPGGSVEWARVVTGAGRDGVSALAVDADGFIYAAGGIEGTAVVVTREVVADGTDGYIARLSPAGDLIGVTPLSGPGEDRVTGLASAAGALFYAGIFEQSVVLPSGPLTAAGGFDAFIARVETSALE